MPPLFSFSWDGYKPHICEGLSSLQQNGELVDMTLAADGHHVKVHRLLISLVSPYLRDILESASCAHPVIFLNKMSYSTLCAILEYIYSGEAVVAREQLPEMIQAAKELRIKGLEALTIDEEDDVTNPKLQLVKQQIKSRTRRKVDEVENSESETPMSEAQNRRTNESNTSTKSLASESEITMETGLNDSMDYNEEYIDPSSDQPDTETETNKDYSVETLETDENKKTRAGKRKCTETTPSSTSLMVDTQTQDPSKPQPSIMYTMSPLGKLQMIVNRYIYFVRYTSVKGTGGDGYRNWRCVEYFKNRCPATVFTNNDVIVSRVGAHKHAYHDKRILKKVQSNSVFTTVQAAVSHKTRRLD